WKVLRAGAARSERAVGAAARTAQRRRDRQADRREGTPGDHLVVAPSGSLAHVYLTDEPGRAARETVDRRYPGLVAALGRQPGVGAVLTRGSDGVLRVDGPAGTGELVDGTPRGTHGTDPLTPYGPRAAGDLTDLDRREHVGDLVVLGSYDERLEEVTAFEELVG